MHPTLSVILTPKADPAAATSATSLRSSLLDGVEDIATAEDVVAKGSGDPSTDRVDGRTAGPETNASPGQSFIDVLEETPQKPEDSEPDAHKPSKGAEATMPSDPLSKQPGHAPSAPVFPKEATSTNRPGAADTAAQPLTGPARTAIAHPQPPSSSTSGAPATFSGESRLAPNAQRPFEPDRGEGIRTGSHHGTVGTSKGSATGETDSKVIASPQPWLRNQQPEGSGTDFSSQTKTGTRTAPSQPQGPINLAPQTAGTSQTVSPAALGLQAVETAALNPSEALARHYPRRSEGGFDQPQKPVAALVALPKTTSAPAAISSTPSAPLQLHAEIRERAKTSTAILDADPLSTPRSDTPITTPSQSPTAISRADLPHHVARQIAEVFQHAPARPVEITLNPEELGRVRLALSSSNAGIVVHVLAERPETMDLLRRHIAALETAFQHIGYADIAFSFTRQGNSDHGGRAAQDFVTVPPAGPDTPAPIEIALNTRAVSGLDIRL